MHDPEYTLRTGCIVDGSLVVLDRIASRYFLLTKAHPCAAGAAQRTHTHQTAVLRWEDNLPIRHDTACERWVTRVRSDDYPIGRSGTRALAFLRFLEWRYASAMRGGGLDAGLAKLETLTPRKNSLHAQGTLIAAARQSKRFWSSRDRCLPRALAVTHALRAAGSSAQLVVGVALHPFAAHAWVQSGDIVLSDALDHVALFTPILIA